MGVSVRFYRDVLGMDLVYGGKDAYFLFASLEDAEFRNLDLEQNRAVTRWGRMIF